MSSNDIISQLRLMNRNNMKIFARADSFTFYSATASIGHPWPLTIIVLLLGVLAVVIYFRNLKLAEVLWVDNLLFKVFQIWKIISNILKSNLLRIFRYVIKFICLIFFNCVLFVAQFNNILYDSIYAVSQLTLFW